MMEAVESVQGDRMREERDARARGPKRWFLFIWPDPKGPTAERPFRSALEWLPSLVLFREGERRSAVVYLSVVVACGLSLIFSREKETVIPSFGMLPYLWFFVLISTWVTTLGEGIQRRSRRLRKVATIGEASGAVLKIGRFIPFRWRTDLTEDDVKEAGEGFVLRSPSLASEIVVDRVYVDERLPGWSADQAFATDGTRVVFRRTKEVTFSGALIPISAS